MGARNRLRSLLPSWRVPTAGRRYGELVRGGGLEAASPACQRGSAKEVPGESEKSSLRNADAECICAVGRRLWGVTTWEISPRPGDYPQLMAICTDVGDSRQGSRAYPASLACKLWDFPCP